jgi:hypothetical protein
MEYIMELIEESGTPPNREIVSNLDVGRVVCPSINSVANVARAIATGYYDKQPRPTNRYKNMFSVVVFTYSDIELRYVKVVHCYPGMTTYYMED